MSIQLGNDEFILYIRKRFPNCDQTNDWLGKHIWQWIRNADPAAEIVEKDFPCYWDIPGDAIDRLRLPKTAAQISFRRNILPDLFAYLDQLGNE